MNEVIKTMTLSGGSVTVTIKSEGPIDESTYPVLQDERLRDSASVLIFMADTMKTRKAGE